MKENGKIFPGYISAIGCLIVMFMFMGALQTIGVFIPSIAADGYSVAGVGYMIIFANGSGFLLSMVAGNVIKKLGPKMTIALCSFLCAGHFIIYSFATSIWTLYIGAMVGGFTIAWGTHSCMATVISSWFVKKRGTMIGIVFGGAGFGATFMTWLSGQTIHAFGWRNAYRVVALILLVSTLLVNLLFIRDPKKMGIKPLGWEEEEIINAGAAKASAEAIGIARKDAVRTPAFWCLCIGLFLSAFLLTGFSNYAPAFWQSRGISAVTTSNWIAVYSFVGALAVLAAGIMADKFGPWLFASYNYVVYIIGIVILLITGGANLVGPALAVCVLCGLAYPTTGSINAILIKTVFGDRDYTNINTVIHGFVVLGKGLTAVTVGVALTATGDYIVPFGILIGCGVVAFVLVMVALKNAPMKKLLGQMAAEEKS